MPFFYDLPMPAVDSSEDATLERWLAGPHDRLTRGTPVALVSVGDSHFEVLANGDGILGDLLLEPGAAVPPGESLAVVYADGESIPYGRPYSLLGPT